MIIVRYITKEVLATFLAITTILLLIALSNRFAMYLAKAATGELPVGLVFRLVWLYIPELLSFLIPLSFFLAILFAYGRMYADSEMAVLFSCGVSLNYITRITLILAACIMVITGFLSLWVVPTITLYRERVVSEGEALAVIHSLLPGRFQTLETGNMVFYIEDIAAKEKSKEKSIKGVFIAEQPMQSSPKNDGQGQGKKTQDMWTLITAEEALIERSPKSKDFYLVLKEGHRYQGVPGAGNYTVVNFKEYGRSVQRQNAGIIPETQKLKSSNALFRSASLEDAAEFQWRLSIPLSVLILALMAVSLSRVNPRHGRFAKFLPAIVLYIIYYNLFTLSKRWIISKVLPVGLGVWWVHAVFLMIGLLWLAKESGGLKQPRSLKSAPKASPKRLITAKTTSEG